jgi:hypothetical protein
MQQMGEILPFIYLGHELKTNHESLYGARTFIGGSCSA